MTTKLYDTDARLVEMDARLTRLEATLTRLEGTVDHIEAKLLTTRDLWWVGLALTLEILVGFGLAAWWR
jgi:hypothetical protein